MDDLSLLDESEPRGSLNCQRCGRFVSAKDAKISAGRDSDGYRLSWYEADAFCPDGRGCNAMTDHNSADAAPLSNPPAEIGDATRSKRRSATPGGDAA